MISFVARRYQRIVYQFFNIKYQEKALLNVKVLCADVEQPAIDNLPTQWDINKRLTRLHWSALLTSKMRVFISFNYTAFGLFCMISEHFSIIFMLPQQSSFRDTCFSSESDEILR